MAQETIRALQEHRAHVHHMRTTAKTRWQEHDLVFPSSIGTPLGTYTLNRTWWALIASAKLPRIRFHDLRHTYASLALAQKISPKVVSERLGHANVAFTLQTYAHVYEEEHRAAALDSAQLFSPRATTATTSTRKRPAAKASAKKTSKAS